MFSTGAADADNSWLLQQFSLLQLLDQSVSGDFADPDNDMVVNLLEYALGSDPWRPSLAALPQAEIETISGELEAFVGGSGDSGFVARRSYLKMTVDLEQRRSDLRYIVEVSTDLVTWRSGAPHTVTTHGTPSTLIVYDATPIGERQRRFMRPTVESRSD